MSELRINEVYELNTKILSEPNEILKYLHIGIYLPVLPELYKYILEDIKNFNAKAIILEKNISEENFKNYIDKS